MPSSTKIEPCGKHCLRFKSGSTVTNTAGTFTMNGTVNVTTPSLEVTNAATVGSTLGVTGNFAVNSTYFTIDATTGNVISKGTFTAGLVASGKAIILDPAGAKSTPATDCMQFYTDGSDIYATRANGNTSKLNTGAWT